MAWNIPVFSQYDTSCTNLSQVNSVNDEYMPFLVDSSLLFTSNRKNTLEGQSLEFTEKVYISNKKKGTWSNAKKVGYKWNSDNNTALVGVSLKNFYFYRSYWKDNGEIFIASRKADTLVSMKAAQLKKVKSICTNFDENSITTVKDDTLYFVSNRSGNYDIYMQTGKDSAVAVKQLNTEYNEEDIFISNDRKTLYFSSDRPGGKGGFDIYKSTKVNNQWSSPVSMTSKYINTAADDRDFRWYNDSTMFLSSNRDGGVGGFDIYQITTKKIRHEAPAVIAVDTVKQAPPVEEIKQEKSELVDELTKLNLIPFKGEIQLGAYRYIMNIAVFKRTFKCIEKEDIRMDTINVDGKIIHKFIIDKVYTDVDEAIKAQLDFVNRNCLPNKDFEDMPFIATLDQSGKRFSIFWKKDEFESKNTFIIYSNGQRVWKGKRF